MNSAQEKRVSWLAIIPIALPAIMSNIHFTAVNIALPWMAKDLRGSLSTMQWVMGGYCMAAACLVVFGGRLADMLGKRRMLVSCTVVFMLASAAAGVAHEPWQLIVSRFVQGGAIVVYPIALALTSILFAGKHRNLALGIVGAGAGAAAALGPTVGGIILHWLGWRWVFYINIPIGMLGIALTLAWIPETKRESERKLDWIGQVLLTMGLFSVLLALNRGAEWGFVSPAFFSSLLAGVLLLACFLWTEQRVAEPLIDPRLLGNHCLVGANAARFLFQYVCLGSVFLISLFIQNVLLFSPLTAGLTLLWFTGTVGLLAPLMGCFMDRIGTRGPVSIGLALVGGACCLLSTASVETDLPDLWMPLLLFGIGTAALFPGLISTALSSVPESETGLASGLLYMNSFMGGAIGVAVTGVLMQFRTGGLIGEPLAAEPVREAFLSGFKLNMQTYAVICAVAALLTWLTGAGACSGTER